MAPTGSRSSRSTSTTPQFTIAFDGSAGSAAKFFGVSGLPNTVLIGADGRVIHQHRGFRSEDKPEIEARIQAALGERLAGAKTAAAGSAKQ